MTYTKLIERMRTDSAFDFTTLGNEAADAIEALQAENERLAHANNALKLAVSGLQTQLDTKGKGEPVQFLCDATRFKVRRHKGDEASRIFGLPNELNGRWVALVAADDDCHLKLAAPKALAPLTQPEVVEAFCNTRHNTQYVSVFDAGVRFAEKHHGIGGTP